MSWLLECVVGAALAAPQDLEVRGTIVHRSAANAEAGTIVASGGRFLFVGPNWAAAKATLSAVPDGTPKTIELERAHAFPGLHDAHGHVLGLGHALANVDLTGTASYDDVIARVVARAKEVPKGEWIQGRGWDQNRWPKKAFPSHEALSKAVPDHPVWLDRVDGHAGLGNQKALELAGVSKATTAPSGGEILRADNGEPTGVFVDRATALVERAIPAVTDPQRERWLLTAQQACLSAGLTMVHDAGVDIPTLKMLRRLWLEKRWKLRVYVLLSASEVEAILEGPWQTPDGVLVVRAVKGYADGALGSRGAALLEDYSDRKGHRGLLLTPKAGLEKLAKLCAQSRMQLCVHAIGDRANREVLDVFSGAFLKVEDLLAARWRIEHAQVVAPADFDRFRALGVLASMQPTHLTSDMPWAQERLGEERTKGAYAWRSFLERKVALPFGSDFPVESHDPRKGLYAAVTTKAEGTDRELRPDQKLTRIEALEGFTTRAAFAAFQDHELGRIEPGYCADLTIFDRDLMTCPPEEILTARVLATIVGGEVVWRAPTK